LRVHALQRAARSGAGAVRARMYSAQPQLYTQTHGTALASARGRPPAASKQALMAPGRRAQGKTNFFERRVGEYQRAGVMAGMRPGRAGGERASDYTFTTDEDF